MALITDFKTQISYSGSDRDQYFIDYYLKPAIDRAAVLATNVKQTTITLTSGVQTYDLTASNKANPVVSTAGIQELMYDPNLYMPYEYKRDFYIQDLTTLYFVKSDIPASGTFTFLYNEFFTKPTLPSTDGNLPTRLYPAVIKYAKALYDEDMVSDSTNGFEEKSEANLRIKYGQATNKLEAIQSNKEKAEQMMLENGASSSFNFWSIQVF